MQNNGILERLEKIFSDILDNNNISLSRSTTPNDIEEWDSITNIEIIVQAEKAFNIKFSLGEMLEFKNVGDICDTIAKRL